MKKVIKKVSYILKKPIRGVGEIGKLVKIAPLYGRFLSENGSAIRATEEEMARIEANKRNWQEHEKENELVAKKVLEKIKKISKIKIAKRVSQGDRLYETVKIADILLAIEKLGVTLKKSDLKVDNIMKKVGIFKIIVNPYGNLIEELEVEILAEEKE